MDASLRTRVTRFGCVLLLALMLPLMTAPPERAGTPGEPRPDLIAAELLAGAGDNPVDALIVLESAPRLVSSRGDRGAVVSALKATADRSQAEVVRLVDRHGDEVLDRLWIHNAVLVRSRPDTLLAASGLDGVQRIIPNFEVRVPETELEAADADLEARADARYQAAVIDDRTWGIDRIRAHEVWQQLGLDGSGVRVATLDTGVEARHADLAGKLVTDDPDDPFHPGGWIAFAGGGEPMPIEPVDSHGHGTHVSGTIHGGDTTGVSIGAAPGAEMMHAMVLPGGVGDFANVAAGMQWALEPFDAAGQPAGQPADVVNMSLGEVGFVDEFIAPVRNLLAAGVLPVVAIGNDCGIGNTASPGNVFGAVGTGATDIDDDVASFSCGGVVDKGHWSDPPEDWPDSYVKPDLSAPGVEVYSAYLGGSHTFGTGTSMAAPHVAGAASLMLQAVPDLGVDQLADTLADTAFFDDRHGPQRPNPRFGHGRIDAYAAVDAVVAGSGVTGTVTDAATRAPLAGATVTAAGVDLAVDTGADGGYQLRIEPGTYQVEVRRFGYEPATYPDVVVVEDELTTLDPELEPVPTGTVAGQVVYAPSGHGVPGARVDVLDQPVETTSDGAGGFAVELPAGDYQLRATAARLRDSLDVEVAVVAGETTDVQLTVRPLGRTEQVDVASDGTPANTASAAPSISADGRYVAFQSAASNLVPGVTNGQNDIYVHDRRTGVTERVSVASDGTESNGSSHRPAISADGRFVAFDGTATNLVDDPPASNIQTFVHDRATGETELVSRSSAGEPANDWSRDSAISGDGRYVLFGSRATNLVPGAEPGHIYIRDREEGTTRIASVASDGTPANNSSLDAGISDDGSQLAFRSAATNLDDGIRNGLFDVFVRDRDAGETSRVSLSTGGQEAEGGANTQAVISGDGRVAAWDSRAHNLDDGITNGVYDVFVHDRDTGETARVSLSSDGEQGDRNSRNPALSGNGRYVAFDSVSDTLDDGITNNASDVFVHDRDTGETARESLTVDGEEADSNSGQQVLDHDGRFLAFRSFATNLVDHQTSPNFSLFVRDRFGTDDPEPQFALWDLQVDEPVVQPSDEVGVSVRVSNIGEAGGSYPAQLRIDGRPEASEEVDLAPGGTATVSWTLSREELGTYQVAVGPLSTQFRVRAPLVELSASTLEGGGHEAGPLGGAEVELIHEGQRIPVGSTDQDGRLGFETTEPDASYTVVVRRPATDGHDLAYLLTHPQRIDDDTTITLAPATLADPQASTAQAAHPAAVVDLRPDLVADDHQAWTYLQHPGTAPHGYAYPGGQLVTTVSEDSFHAVNVHTIPGLARDWWAVSGIVDDLAWPDPVDYQYSFGGPAQPQLEAGMVDETSFEASWSVTDDHGHRFAAISATGLRPFAVTDTTVPDVLTLEQVADMVASQAPHPGEVILRLDDPDQTAIHAGGVDWDQPTLTRDLAELTEPVTPGTYTLHLDIDTGTYSGQLTDQSTFLVDTVGPDLDWVTPQHGQAFFDRQVSVAGTVTDDPAGVAEVLVNGERAELDDDGGWELGITLDAGEDEITVTAVDNLDNQTTETRTVALLDYSAEWRVPGGSAAATYVSLRILDSGGDPTAVDGALLEARAGDGTVFGPFEMEWRADRYLHVLRGLPRDDYDLVGRLDVEGWTVELAGPTITTR